MDFTDAIKISIQKQTTLNSCDGFLESEKNIEAKYIQDSAIKCLYSIKQMEVKTIHEYLGFKIQIHLLWKMSDVNRIFQKVHEEELLYYKIFKL